MSVEGRPSAPGWRSGHTRIHRALRLAERKAYFYAAMNVIVSLCRLHQPDDQAGVGFPPSGVSATPATEFSTSATAR